jgi:DNA (cytosine-5)-methyltransferase 1
MRHGSLFSGIGGFDLASQWMGWENVFHCEWMEFPRKVLHHYWPDAISYHDITQTDFTKHYGSIDILTGGFPCQPYSAAGKRKGKDDERHLWPHMLRAIREIRPRWVVGENVFGIVTWNDGLVFEEVCAELESEGYEVQPFILPAAAVNAPHRRDRVWFVAHAQSIGFSARQQRSQRGWAECQQQGRQIWRGFTTISQKRIASNAKMPRSPRQCEHRSWQGKSDGCDSFGIPADWEVFPTVTPICGGDDGIPRELDGITFPKWRAESIKGYGNAIVPQVALQIFRAIAAMEPHS